MFYFAAESDDARDESEYIENKLQEDEMDNRTVHTETEKGDRRKVGLIIFGMALCKFNKMFHTGTVLWRCKQE